MNGYHERGNFLLHFDAYNSGITGRIFKVAFPWVLYSPLPNYYSSIMFSDGLSWLQCSIKRWQHHRGEGLHTITMFGKHCTFLATKKLQVPLGLIAPRLFQYYTHSIFGQCSTLLHFLFYQDWLIVAVSPCCGSFFVGSTAFIQYFFYITSTLATIQISSSYLLH